MSTVQGPPANSQQPPAADSNKTSGNNKAQEREAERGSGDFDKALNKKKEQAGHEGLRSAEKGEKKDGLEDLFRQAHSKKKDEGGKDDDAKAQSSDAKAQTGEAMAQSDAAKAMEVRVGKTAEIQSVDNKQMIDRIEKIADKIMVSNATDVKAVKVDFKDGVLPGTEVMIRKDAAGKLQIEFTTTSSESFNFLNKGEQTLVDTLNRKLGGDVSVDIKMQGGGADQDTGDGRSREQYLADEDDKDQKDD